jgi:Icc-related predicted phosphoesterase
MMKIQLVSDLHSEFFESTEQAVETTVQILPSDVQVVAGDIVITHHTPLGPLTDRLQSGEIFDFSGTNLIKLMAERSPSLWLFGHQHSTYDLMLYSTRLYCNPFGYYDHILNETYRADLILQI